MTTTSTSEVIDPNTPGVPVELAIRIESHLDDVTQADFEAKVMAVLDDPRGWAQAGVTFIADPEADLRVVLAEPTVVDELCRPLRTSSEVSCQNGSVVAMNATRWRTATVTWDSDVDAYRTYLINHELGHLFGMRHPTPRCPTRGSAAAVMEQQTKGLEGCTGNGWPLPWEIELARKRPAMIGPAPDWAPGPPPINPGP